MSPGEPRQDGGDLAAVLEVIAGAQNALQLRGVAVLAAMLEPEDRELARWAYAYALAQLKEPAR